MATNSSDFVLDEGLDDDEDVLAYHSSRLQQEIDEEQDSTLTTSQSSTENNLAPDTPNHTTQPISNDIAQNLPTAVIIDGLPIKSSRSELNAFLPSTSLQHIVSVRLRRLESHELLRVRVEFDNQQSTNDTLQLDGSQLHQTNGPHLSVKVATPERWDASNEQKSTAITHRNQLSTPSAFDTMRSSFWGAMSTAKGIAERLEDSARHISNQIEDRLHVSEKVEQTRNSVQQLDQQYQVQQRLGEAVESSRKAAQDIDKTYGISDNVGKVSESVGNAAKIVAREVDENLRVSDKARVVTNAALKNETLAPMARSVVGGISDSNNSNKNYQPATVQNRQDAGNKEPIVGD